MKTWKKFAITAKCFSGTEWIKLFTSEKTGEIRKWLSAFTNSSDAKEGILWLNWWISCLLMPWLLKAPVHLQVQYWLCRTDNMYWCSRVNSLGPSDAIWHCRSWSTLVQVMAYCLTAPSHYLNQCWLIISKVLLHSSEDIIMKRFEDTNQ